MDLSLRVLITGAGGQLGQALQSMLLPCVDLLALKHEQLDIADQNQVAEKIAALKPQLIINAAAYNAVDLAQQETQKAYAVNAQGVKNLAQEAGKLNCPVIHISTDYVFDGALQRPYTENDAPNPVNVYGATKFAGEQFLHGVDSRFMIVRVSSLFGGVKNNFVERILRLAQERNEGQNELKVVDDQMSCPTPVDALARALWMLVERYVAKGELPFGVWHFAGAPACSRYEWAHYIIEQARNMGLLTHDVRVIASKTIENPLLARRPVYSVLDCRKWISEFGIAQPDWREGVQNCLLRFC